MKNTHAQSVPQEVLQEVMGHIDAASSALSAYLLTLTPAERHEMLKMGDKTLSFVEKAGELSQNNPMLCPPYFNNDEFQIDLSDAVGLRIIKNKMQQLLDGIDDTAMAAGSEAFQSALVFYNTAKLAAKQDVQGAKAVYEELKKRFPLVRKAKEDEEEKK